MEIFMSREKRFLTSSETNGFGDTYLSLTNFFHFGGKKMPFLPSREI